MPDIMGAGGEEAFPSPEDEAVKRAALCCAGSLALAAGCSQSPPPPRDGGCPPPVFINALDAGPSSVPFIATLAGGVCGDSPGSLGPEGSFSFGSPGGIAVDAQGAIYLSDIDNHVIWQIAKGQAVRFSGSGHAGFLDGPNDTSQFDRPIAMDFDAQGNLVVADSEERAVRLVEPDGTVSTLFASQDPDWRPRAVAVNRRSGTVYIVENKRIFAFSADAGLTILAGNGTFGYVDGTGGPDGGAEFAVPNGVALDDAGYVFVADLNIRKVDPLTGDVTTFSGAVPPDILARGYTDGPGSTASFDGPNALIWMPDGFLYVADGVTIRKVDSTGTVATLLGSPDGYACYSDGIFPSAWTAPSSIVGDGPGRLLVAEQDGENHAIFLCTLREFFLP